MLPSGYTSALFCVYPFMSTTHTWWGIISGTSVTYCLKLMLLSVLWTEIIHMLFTYLLQSRILTAWDELDE